VNDTSIELYLDVFGRHHLISPPRDKSLVFVGGLIGSKPYLLDEFTTTPFALQIATSLGLGALLDDGLPDATSLGQGHLRVFAAANHEDVGLTGGEGVPLLVLDGDDGEGSIVLLEVHELPHASGVVALGDHDHGADLELVSVGHLPGGEGDLDGVVDLDVGIGVTDGASVVRDSHGHLAGGHVHLLDAAELVGCLVLLESVEDESALGVVQEAEAIAALVELDDVHEPRGVVEVGPDLPVDLHAPLHAYLLALLPGEGVLETLAQDDADGEALAGFVRAGGGLGSPHPAHLAEVPVAGRIEALQVLSGSASHGVIIWWITPTMILWDGRYGWVEGGLFWLCGRLVSSFVWWKSMCILHRNSIECRRRRPVAELVE